MTAQSEARQRVIEWLNSARSPSEHRTFGEFFRHAPQVIESIVDALLDDDAVLADVVAAAGRDRVLKVAGLEVIGAIEGIVFDEDLPDGYRRETQYRLPVSEGQSNE